MQQTRLTHTSGDASASPVSSRAQSGKIQPARKKFAADSKPTLKPSSERQKFVQKLAQTHRPRLSHDTDNARKFPCLVAYKAPKFNSLFNFKNLKRRYLYAITLH
jgi:hypothetical protein